MDMVGLTDLPLFQLAVLSIFYCQNIDTIGKLIAARETLIWLIRNKKKKK